MKNEEKKKLQPISDEMLEQVNGGSAYYSSDPFECSGLSKKACESKSVCQWDNNNNICKLVYFHFF